MPLKLPKTQEPPQPQEEKDDFFGRVPWESLNSDERKAIFAAYAGGIGSSIAAPQVLGELSWKVGQKPKLTGSQVRGLRRAMTAKDVKIDVDPVRGPIRNAVAILEKKLKGGKIVPEKRVLSREPLGAGILAHEFGHLTGKWRDKFQKLKKLLPVTAAASLLGAPYLAGKATDPDDTMGRAALKGGLIGSGVGLAGTAPKWAEEARASLRAIRGLRKVKAPIGRAALGLGSAFGTYAAPGLLFGAGTGIIGALLRRARARAKKKQEGRE